MLKIGLVFHFVGYYRRRCYSMLAFSPYFIGFFLLVIHTYGFISVFYFIAHSPLPNLWRMQTVHVVYMVCCAHICVCIAVKTSSHFGVHSVLAKQSTNGLFSRGSDRDTANEERAREDTKKLLTFT